MASWRLFLFFSFSDFSMEVSNAFLVNRSWICCYRIQVIHLLLQHRRVWLELVLSDEPRVKTSPEAEGPLRDFSVQVSKHLGPGAAQDLCYWPYVSLCLLGFFKVWIFKSYSMFWFMFDVKAIILTLLSNLWALFNCLSIIITEIVYFFKVLSSALLNSDWLLPG